MIHYSAQTRDWKFVKRLWIFKKRLDHAQQSATDALKTTWKKVDQNTAEATGDLIGNKITDRIIIAMHLYLSKELKQLQTLQHKVKQIIAPIKMNRDKKSVSWNDKLDLQV